MKERLIGCATLMIVGVLAACLGAALSLEDELPDWIGEEAVLWISTIGGCFSFSGMTAALLIVTEVI